MRNVILSNIYCLVFFTALSSEMGMNPVLELRIGEQYERDHQHQEALNHYRHALNVLIENPIDTQKKMVHALQSRIGNTLYLLENEEETIRIITNEIEEMTSFDAYLLGLAYKKQGKFSDAITAFNKSLFLNGEKISSHWELAVIYILQKNYENAHTHLSYLKETKWGLEARLLDIYIDIANQQYIEASEKLCDLEGPYSCFLSGYIEMKRGHFCKALPFFEAFLPHCSYLQIPLIQGYIGWCHYQLDHIEEAEKIFSLLINQSDDFAYQIAYAGCVTPEKAAEMLKKEALHNSHALLLFAKSLSSPPERALLYQKCIQGRHLKTKAYGDRCFLYGLTELSRPQDDESYQQASSLFQHAYEAYSSHQDERADSALLYEIQAAIKLGTEEELNLAYRKLLSKIGNHPKGLYLKGLIEYRLNRLVEAEETWKGASDPASLFALGSIYYQNENFSQAEDAFSLAADLYKEDPHASKALYFASLATKDPKKQEIYTERLNKDFPQSEQAAEASFHQYKQQEYLSENRDGENHLEQFINLYPRSPYTIQAYYLMGLKLSKSDSSKAVDAFKKCEKHLLTLNLNEKEKKYYQSISYRAAIERSLIYLSIGDEAQGAKQKIYYEYAIEALLAILQEMDQGLLYDEASYVLAQGYMKSQDFNKASKILDPLIQSFADRHISRSYFLSRSYYEKGLIAFKREEYEKAIYYYNRSDEAGKGNALTGDQKIDLLIQKALCYRELGDIDASLLTLSTAVNEDVISSLRLKAMYLRGEVYSSQGRVDLARRQYEALITKKGEWADLAKGQLEKMRQELMGVSK